MATLTETAPSPTALPALEVPAGSASASALPDEILAQISADEFFAMVEAEVFTPNRRVFLWDGRICEKMSKTWPHAVAAVEIADLIRSRLPAGWTVWPENPIRLDASHAPLPDIAIVRGRPSLYRRLKRHPDARDVGLIVEVAVTSLARDLGERAEKFARASVPIYWVADVFDRKIIAHRGPRTIEGVGSYADVQVLTARQEIELMFDGQLIGPILVAELLPAE